MPFTPIHLGAGAAFKAMGGRHFSFLIFAGSQVLIDIEPLLGIINGWQVLHGMSHTVLGALVIGSCAAVIGRPMSQWLLKSTQLPYQSLTWPVAFASAYVGTFSHIALDAIMHSDMSPLWPLSLDNHWLGMISLNQLHLLCVMLGVIGLTVMGIKAAWRQ
jgi:membrane-bound metal-dependent hydrolase YbcI (DUF457 family)